MVNPPPLPDDCGILSLIYDFGPSGAVFDKPVTIVLEYDPASLCPGTPEDSIYIAWFDTNINQWIKLESL
jgi:hypothetical protein